MSLILRSLKLIRQIHSRSYVISCAGQKERMEIGRLMQDIFFKTDPSSIYSKVSEINCISSVMREMTLETLGENSSFVAKENEKDNRIFGVAVNGVRPLIVQSNCIEYLLSKVKSKSERTLLELWWFVSTMPCDSEKYFEGACDLFEIRYLVVEPAYRNQGVARALVNRSIKEAAARGFKYIRVDCTSHFTARIASSAGMQCIYEINYQDYKNPRGEYVFPDVVFPHTKIHVYTGKSIP